MRTDEVVKHFGSQQKAAEALAGCSQSAVSQWGEFPPLVRQLEIERVTKGLLRASPECDALRFPVPRKKAEAA